MDTGLTLKDLKDELAAVRKARMALYAAGQTYNRPGLMIVRANLDALSKREQQILTMMAKMDASGVVGVGDCSGPQASIGSDAEFVKGDDADGS